MINEFVSDICDILNINKPVVSFDTSNFQTKTMLAQCLPDENIIFIQKCDKPNLDQFFCITHELRHIWQFQTDKDRYFRDYKSADMCESTETYNMQLAEIDANAFALIIMFDFFGIKPLFNGLSEAVKQRIYSRVNEVAAEIKRI